MNEFADFGWAVQQMSPSEERAALARSITKMQIRVALDTRTLLHLVTSPMCDNAGACIWSGQPNLKIRARVKQVCRRRTGPGA